jgi:hypothetical protein
MKSRKCLDNQCDNSVSKINPSHGVRIGKVVSVWAMKEYRVVEV